MIAKIAVSAATYAIDKPYSYFIPAEMALVPGVRVIVPFGRGNRRSEGMVLAVEEGSAQGLKAVESCLDSEPLLDPRMLRLAAFLRERYFCTFYDAVRAMLPAGLWYRPAERFALTEDRSWKEKNIKNPQALALLQLLEDLGGETLEPMLREAVPDEEEFAKAVAYLVRKKWIQGRTEYKRKTSDKTERIATLASSPEEALEYAASRPRSAAMQRAVLELLCSLGSVAVKEICYFTGASTATVNRLEKLGYLTLSSRPVLRCREIKPAKLEGPLTLNGEQTAAFDGLSAQMAQPDPGVALLHGVTGSGKTSVYIKLIQTCLDAGRTAMLLVPEIALTPQLLGVMAAHFGETVAVLHSSLAAGERQDQWKRLRDGSARLVVGTRSAVFAPCRDLGLIILDEEQEHSYKSENSPRYSAKEVAIWRGAKEKALVVFGSATPSVETMYRAKRGDYTLYTLKNRYNGRDLPDVRIVDMGAEIREGNDLAYSYDLLDAIRETAKAGKQTVLFLNRRGNARALVCVDCRQAPECPRCNARLTYHSANERMMCHYCGFSQPRPKRCPRCDGPMKSVGVGTQKAQEELNRLAPEIEIDRMDADTVTATNSHQQILDHFTENHVPVLIGTQMVAKGLNLPDVTLVGVLDADLGLYSDSFRAAETTFNMLTQVVGRSGRGEYPGRAMIQTLVPQHQVIRLAAEQNYEGFYELEIGMRRIQNCPPFGDIAHITFVGQDESQVLRAGAKFRDSLLHCFQMAAYAGETCTVLGPAPCPVPKINYNYRYRLTLRCAMSRNLRLLVGDLLRQAAKDPQNRGVSAFADVNGYD